MIKAVVEYMTRPVRRAFGMLPHQKATKWEREISELWQQRGPISHEREILELAEGQELQRGSSAASQAVKKQAAGEIIRIRRRLRRIRSQEALFSQQIDILSGRAHNVRLKQDAANISVPKVDQLAKEASEAEASIQDLQAAAEMSNSLNVVVDELVSADEDDILQEFDEIAKSWQESKTDEEPTVLVREHMRKKPKQQERQELKE